MVMALETLDCFPVFGGVDPAVRAALSARLVEQQAARQSVVFREGDSCLGLYLLFSGRVKLSRHSSDGRELAIAVLRRGDIFDLTAIFDDGPHVATARAVDASTLLFLAKDTLLELTEQHASLVSALLTSVFGDLRRMTDLVEQVGGKSVSARLAALLLARTGDGVHIVLDLSQGEVAALVGTRREVLSRTLGKLERDGILRVAYPQITILDSDRLRRLV